MGEKLKTLKINLAAANHAGKQLGAEAFIKNYEKYRRGSAVFWGLLMLFFFAIGFWSMALLCIAVLHLHLLFNQLWWKLINLEHFYLKKEDNHEMEDLQKAD